jgi:hypothetical protein
MQQFCAESGEPQPVSTDHVMHEGMRERGRSTHITEPSFEDPALILGLEPPPDELIEAENYLSRVSGLIDEMAPRTREVFLLHQIDECEYPEIARHLGLHLKEIEDHIMRALLALTREQPSPDHGPDSLRNLAASAEASAWLARLRSPSRTARVEQGFQRWLTADAAHAQVFELLSERLEIAERLRNRSLPRHWGRRARWQRRPSWPMTLGVLAVVFVIGTLGSIVYRRHAGISTGAGEMRTMTLVDGSRIEMNPDTRVIVRYDGQARRVELKKGRATFQVTRLAGSPFVVQAGNCQVRATGTKFSVGWEQGALTITVLQGQVSTSKGCPAPARNRSADR